MRIVEACHEVEAVFLDVLDARLLRAYAITQPVGDGMPISLFHARRVEVVSTDFWKSSISGVRKADPAVDLGDLSSRL
jgi:hypothetical protein